MPNAFAYLMLLAWPVIVIAMFRQMPAERALIWSILGGYMLLPPVAALDPPLLPALDKHAIPALSAFACLLASGHKIRLLPATKPGKILLLILLLSPIGTVLTNSDPVLFAIGGLPGLTWRDIPSSAAYQFMMVLPFLLAREILATPAAQRELLRALMIAGLIYSIPMLYEMRMSPQLNTKIYGFFQHGFDQTIRFGGFRPIVFMQHGLWVAFFALSALAAAAALWRFAAPEQRMRYIAATLYLGVILLFCRSLGPLVLAAALVPLVFFASQRMQLRVAALLALIVLCYPILRSAELVPVEMMLEQAQRIDGHREGSLKFRFDHEAALLEHARQRPYFGWGAWDRNLVHDYESGRRLSVSDGRWVIVIGIGGWFAYIAEFGLLQLALLMLMRSAGQDALRAQAPYLGALSLILAFNLVDLIPNATLTSLTWMISGALLGYAEALRAGTLPAPQQANRKIPVATIITARPRGRIRL